MIPDCRNIREHILKIAKKSRHGHIPSSFSIVEILYAVYGIMKYDPKNPQWDERDLFVLSKGHAALAQYCVLAHFGYFDIEQVYSFSTFMSKFGCHADRTKVPGVEVSTGSLGHGIGVAVGMALGLKIDNTDRRVFTLIGDGESNEGSVWEAIMVAVNLKLDNLTVIYDNNKSHSRGLQIHNPAEHFRGFGCDVVSVDGHDVNAIRKVLLEKSDGVRVVIANTQKGYNCKTLIDNQYIWHGKQPNDEEYETLIGELAL